MNRVRILIVLATFAFSNAEVSHALAENCQDDLRSEREGMIDMREAVRTETVSSREALRLLGDTGDVSSSLNFRRRVEDFWRIKVKRSVDPADLVVRYTVLGGGDRIGDASHRDAAGVRFPIRLITDTPRILCEDRDFRIVSGGFTLMARAAGIGLAGFYELEIDVDVEER